MPAHRRRPRSPPREARWAQPAMPLREGRCVHPRLNLLVAAARESAVLAMAAQPAVICADIAARPGPEHRPGPRRETAVRRRARRGDRPLFRSETPIVPPNFRSKPRRFPVLAPNFHHKVRSGGTETTVARAARRPKVRGESPAAATELSDRKFGTGHYCDPGHFVCPSFLPHASAAKPRNPTTPRPHAKSSNWKSAPEAAAACRGRARGAASPSGLVSARRPCLDLSPAPDWQAMARCDRLVAECGGGARAAQRTRELAR